MTDQFQHEDVRVSRFRVVISQVIACLCLDLLLIDLGMSISFVTVVIPEVLDAKDGLSIDEYQASWFGSIGFLCQPLGSIFSGSILDHFGRRKALFLVNIPHLVAWILLYYAWNVPTLLIANALLGIGTGIMEAPSITYIGEVRRILLIYNVAVVTQLQGMSFLQSCLGLTGSDLKNTTLMQCGFEASIRGLLTTLTNGFTMTGMFAAYLLGTVLPWRLAALTCVTIPLVTMIMVLLVPETPIWLLSKGRQKEALKSLCRLRGWAPPQAVKDEFDELLNYNEILNQCPVCIKTGNRETSCAHRELNFVKRVTMKIRYVFLSKDTLRPFSLVMAYFLFHTLSGLGPVKPNMVNLCRAMGMKYDPKILVVIVGVLYVVTSVISAVAVKSVGKRKLVVSSMVATSLCTIAISIYASVTLSPNVFSYDVKTFPEQNNVGAVILFLALVFFTSLGIPWVLLSEVFPFRSRGMATGLAAAGSYLIMFVATKTNYDLELHLGLAGVFAFYTVFGITGTLYMYLMLPETENKTLIEIEEYYRGKCTIFADDCIVKKFKRTNNKEADKPMLVI